MEPEESSHVELSVCLVLGVLEFGELLSTSDSLSNTTDQQTPEIRRILCVKVATNSVVPAQAQIGPEGSRALRLPGFSDSRHMKVVRSALRTGRLYSQGNSWYSFLLEAEWTPVLVNADRRIRSLENFQRPHRKSNPRSLVVWRNATARSSGAMYSFKNNF